MSLLPNHEIHERMHIYMPTSLSSDGTAAYQSQPITRQRRTCHSANGVSPHPTSSLLLAGLR